MPSLHPPSGMNSAVLLRQITIFMFPPAFIMYLVHGIGSSYAFPALGLLPLAGSALMGLSLLFRDNLAAFASPVQALSSSNIFFADSVLSVFLIMAIIPTWVFLTEPEHTPMVVLGTYCSVFMLASFAIHFYFAAAEALHLITARTHPFKSLAAEYTPLTSNYQDETEGFEQGSVRV